MGGSGSGADWQPAARRPDEQAVRPAGSRDLGPRLALGATIVLSNPAPAADPGGEILVDVRVRNIGSVVDEFALSVDGPTAGWAEIVPPRISLMPGTEGEARVRFRPPRAWSTRAGPTEFTVAAASREQPGSVAVANGLLTVGPFRDLAARLVPQTSRASGRAQFEVAIENRGNVRADVKLEPSDPDQVLELALEGQALAIEAGRTGRVQLSVAPRSRMWFGAPVTRVFRVDAIPLGSPALALTGNYVQLPRLPRWPAVAAAVALALLAGLAAIVLLFGGGSPPQGPSPAPSRELPATLSPVSSPSAVVSPTPTPTTPVATPTLPPATPTLPPVTPTPQVNGIPSATIETPSDNTAFEYDPATCLRSTPQVCSATVTLIARILDPEEGLLQGDSVIWTTTPTVNGVTLDKSTLGRGDILGGVTLQTYRCTVSSHLITVTARDFEGAQASASVTVTVGPGPADAAACP